MKMMMTMMMMMTQVTMDMMMAMLLLLVLMMTVVTMIITCSIPPHFRFIFSIFHDVFPADTVHLIKLIKHLDLLCSNIFF